MKNKTLIKTLCLGIIMLTSIESITSAQSITTTLKYPSTLKLESSLSISEQLQNLESKYGVELTPTKEISQKDIALIEQSIKDVINSINEIKAEISVPEKIDVSARISQKFSGTATVGASIPAIGAYNVYIPYEYTLVQVGGNPPYFSSASTGVSYAAGIAIGAYSHQETWATITSQSGGTNNVLELRAKGTIVYSAGITNITLPNQVFLKRLYL